MAERLFYEIIGSKQIKANWRKKINPLRVSDDNKFMTILVWSFTNWDFILSRSVVSSYTPVIGMNMCGTKNINNFVSVKYRYEMKWRSDYRGVQYIELSDVKLCCLFSGCKSANSPRTEDGCNACRVALDVSTQTCIPGCPEGNMLTTEKRCIRKYFEDL